jgi:lysophospholipase L1-like esterase
MFLTLGDSVCWGQGLLEEHKLDAIFAANRGLQFTRIAHSGAVIGAPSDSSPEVETGEVPVSFPSLWQQILAPRDWSQFDLLVLNGGINDVSLTRILNPLLSASQIKRLTDQFCLVSMQGLLEKLATLLPVTTRVAVVGYYPILSDQSDPADMELRGLLELHGVATGSVFAADAFSLGSIFPGIVANCITFWQESNQALQAAVDAANTTAQRDFAVFVKLPFDEQNALWAQHPLLWELDDFLFPEDEVSDPRGAACEVLYGDLVHLPKLLQCQRASTGHPNVEGADTIANTLLAVL